MAVTCCYGCVAPKRSPYCHSTCQEYLEARAEHEKEKEKLDRVRDTKCGIQNQKYARVYAAVRKRRYKKL